MRHLQRKLLTFLAASFMLVLLPTAPALAGGQAPPGPTNFTMERVERSEQCSQNDTSSGKKFFADVLITHEMGRTIQLTATTETIEGVEVAYISDPVSVDNEEEHIGFTMTPILKPEWQGLLSIGPWTFAHFNFYEQGHEKGEADELFELCHENYGDPLPFIKGVMTTATQSGQSVLVNVLSNASDPDGDPLEIIAVSQPSVVRGNSNDPRNGQVFIEGNQIRYTPPEETRDYEVSIPYFVSDDKGSWDESFVLVEVNNTALKPPSNGGEAVPPTNNNSFAREEVVRESNNSSTTNDYYPVFASKGGGTTSSYPQDVILDRKARVSHNLVSVTLTCRNTIQCVGTLSLNLGKRTVAKAQFSITEGRHTILVKLTKAAAKSLNKAKSHKLSVVISAPPYAKSTSPALEK